MVDYLTEEKSMERYQIRIINFEYPTPVENFYSPTKSIFYNPFAKGISEYKTLDEWKEQIGDVLLSVPPLSMFGKEFQFITRIVERKVGADPTMET